MIAKGDLFWGGSRHKSESLSSHEDLRIYLDSDLGQMCFLFFLRQSFGDLGDQYKRHCSH